MEVPNFDRFHELVAAHPLFKALHPKEKAALREYYFIKTYRAGDTILFDNDGLESLYLVLEGSVCRLWGERLEGLYFSGDFWGLDCLGAPRRNEGEFKAREDVVLMRFRSEGFRRFRQAFPRIRQGLSPRLDDEGRLLSGFPPKVWKVLKKPLAPRAGLVHYQGRSSRKTFGLFMLVPLFLVFAAFVGMRRSPWFLLLGGGGVILAWCELFLRHMTLYRVTDYTAMKRFFNWRTFKREQDELPLDQIKSVQTNIKGLLRKMLKIGDLFIQTPGRGLAFRNIDHPEELQKTLMALKTGRVEEGEGEKRERFRALVRENLRGQESPGYTGSFSVLRKDREKGRIFRKSGVVLAAQLFLPAGVFLLSFGVEILGAGDFPWGVLLVLWAFRLALAFRILWLYLDWHNDVYKIELPYIWDIERKPFASREEKTQTDLMAVLNVRVSQKGLLRLLLNYGDVIIETPGDSGTLEFFSVARPGEVQSEIFRLREQLIKQKQEIQDSQRLKHFGEFAEILRQVQGAP